MTRNCRNTPVATAQGRFATRMKSAGESVVPMPNMMNWIAGTTSAVSFTPPHSVNADGNVNASAAHASIASPNACRRRSESNLAKFDPFLCLRSFSAYYSIFVARGSWLVVKWGDYNISIFRIENSGRHRL